MPVARLALPQQDQRSHPEAVAPVLSEPLASPSRLCGHSPRAEMAEFSCSQLRGALQYAYERARIKQSGETTGR